MPTGEQSRGLLIGNVNDGDIASEELLSRRGGLTFCRMFRPRGGVGSPYAWLHALMERVVVRDVVLRVVVGFLLGGCLIFAQPNAFAIQSVSLAWDPSPDTNVVGYKVYYGVASRTYTNIVDVGDVTNTTISGLVEGTTYYFAVTAYNILGMESDFSAEVSYTVPVSTGTGNQPPTL